MGDHPDVMVGTASGEDGASVEVLVSGVDVRLTIRRGDRSEAVVFLAPDDAQELVWLLERALEV